MSPKEQVEELLNSIMPMVELHLQNDGALWPFGALVTDSNEHELFSVEADDGREAAAMLVEAAKKSVAPANVVLIGLFVDMTITLPDVGKTDAVKLSFEHRSGYSIDLYIPYKISDSTVEFGDFIAETRKNEIFI